jgi:uroporphyrinogen-III synthase
MGIKAIIKEKMQKIAKSTSNKKATTTKASAANKPASATKPKTNNTTNKSPKPIKKILISQPKPETDKSPYFDLEKKFGVQLNFHPFIKVEGVSSREFRQQKIDIQNYSAIIFTSRYAVDHFFRICEELRVKVSPEMKYYCITEAVALYLQKFTLFRKRKVFFGPDGTLASLFKVIDKLKTEESFIVPSSDINKKEIFDFLESKNFKYAEATLYKTVCNDITDVLKSAHDLIVFFSPLGVKSLFENKPSYKQNGTLLGAFGPTTCKAVEDSGLTLHIKAPQPAAPSMVAALEQFLTSYFKKK